MTDVRGHVYTVELRIESADLNPEQVTKEIGLYPSNSRNSNGGVAKELRGGVWSYDGAAGERKEWDKLEDGLAKLVEELEPLLPRLRLQMLRHRVFWWCGNFQSSFDGGPELSVEILRKLADFGAPLLIDNYFSDVEN